jgi:YggT family protein
MFIQFLANFINLFFQILTIAILGRALLSWFPVRQGNPFYSVAVVLHQITEPILAPLRRVVPTIGTIDITPIVALLLLQFLQGVLVQVLIASARGF